MWLSWVILAVSVLGRPMGELHSTMRSSSPIPIPRQPSISIPTPSSSSSEPPSPWPLSASSDGFSIESSSSSTKSTKKLFSEFIRQPSLDTLPLIQHKLMQGLVELENQPTVYSYEDALGHLNEDVVGLGKSRKSLDHRLFCRNLCQPVMMFLIETEVSLRKSRLETASSTPDSKLIYNTIIQFATEGYIKCTKTTESNLRKKMLSVIAQYWPMSDIVYVGLPSLKMVVDRGNVVELYSAQIVEFSEDSVFNRLFNQRLKERGEREELNKLMEISASSRTKPLSPFIYIEHAMQNEDYPGVVEQLQAVREAFRVKCAENPVVHMPLYHEYMISAFKDFIVFVFNTLNYATPFRQDVDMLFGDIPLDPENDKAIKTFLLFVDEEYCKAFDQFFALISQDNKDKKRKSAKTLSQDNRGLSWLGASRLFSYCLRLKSANNENVSSTMKAYADLKSMAIGKQERRLFYEGIMLMLQSFVKEENPKFGLDTYPSLMKYLVEPVGRKNLVETISRYFGETQVESLLPASAQDVNPQFHLARRVQFYLDLFETQDKKNLEKLMELAEKENSVLINVYPFFKLAMETRNVSVLMTYRDAMSAKAVPGKSRLKDVIDMIDLMVEIIQKDGFEREFWFLRLFVGKAPDVCDTARLDRIDASLGDVNNVNVINIRFLLVFAHYYCRSAHFPRVLKHFQRDTSLVNNDFASMVKFTQSLGDLWELGFSESKRLQGIDIYPSDIEYYATASILLYISTRHSGSEPLWLTSDIYDSFSDSNMVIFSGCQLAHEYPAHPHTSFYADQAKDFLLNKPHSTKMMNNYFMEYSMCLDIVLKEEQYSWDGNGSQAALQLAMTLFQAFPPGITMGVDRIKTLFSQYPQETLPIVKEKILSPNLEDTFKRKERRRLLGFMLDTYPHDLIPVQELKTGLENLNSNVGGLLNRLKAEFPLAFKSAETENIVESGWSIYDPCLQSSTPLTTRIKTKKPKAEPSRRKSLLSCSPPIPSACLLPTSSPISMLIHEDVADDAHLDTHFFQHVYDKISSEFDSKSGYSWDMLKNVPKGLVIYKIPVYVSGVPHRVFFTLHHADRTIHLLMVALRNNCYNPLLFNRTVHRAILRQ